MKPLRSQLRHRRLDVAKENYTSPLQLASIDIETRRDEFAKLPKGYLTVADAIASLPNNRYILLANWQFYVEEQDCGSMLDWSGCREVRACAEPLRAELT